MKLNIHNLKPARGASKKRKVVGRGNASGHGTPPHAEVKAKPPDPAGLIV